VPLPFFTYPPAPHSRHQFEDAWVNLAQSARDYGASALADACFSKALAQTPSNLAALHLRSLMYVMPCLLLHSCDPAFSFRELGVMVVGTTGLDAHALPFVMQTRDCPSSRWTRTACLSLPCACTPWGCSPRPCDGEKFARHIYRFRFTGGTLTSVLCVGTRRSSTVIRSTSVSASRLGQSTKGEVPHCGCAVACLDNVAYPGWRMQGRALI